MSTLNRTDPYQLDRFLEAQLDQYDEVCHELRSGRKTGHWIWFIFPQLEGLGWSAMSQRFAIASREEAKAYLKHPVLGPRLEECARLVLAIEGRSIEEIFGSPDDLKLRSSMTLFAHATDHHPVFASVLKKYFAGCFDPLTLRLLGLEKQDLHHHRALS